MAELVELNTVPLVVEHVRPDVKSIAPLQVLLAGGVDGCANDFSKLSKQTNVIIRRISVELVLMKQDLGIQRIWLNYPMTLILNKVKG